MATTTAAPQAPARAGARWLLPWLGSLLAMLVVVGLRVLRDPGAFFLWDRVAQYAATYHYIGQQLRAGHLPVLVPWQGTAANLLLDPQYGVLSPIYWVQNVVFAGFTDLAIGSTVIVAVFLAVMHSGVFAWVIRLGAGPAWAAAAAFAAPLTGYVFWWSAPSWHPALVSAAFLPWLAWALAARPVTRWSVVSVVLASYACLSTGWPFTSIIAGVLVLAAAVEALLARDVATTVRQVLAAGAGAALAAPTLLFAAGALEWTMRTSGVRNDAFMVPNLMDVLNSSMASAAVNMNFFGSPIDTEPTVLAAGFGIIVVPLIAWNRGLLDSKGFPTVLIAAAAMLVLTQGPTEFGPLRWPVRFIGFWQVSLIVLLAAAAGLAGIRVTRKRLAVTGALLLITAAVTFARTPQQAAWHLVSLVLAIAFVAAFAAMTRPSRVWLLIAVSAAITLTATVHQPTSPNLPPRIPADTAAFQDSLAGTDQRVLTLFPDGLDYSSLVAQGVYPGQNILLSQARAGVGYTSVGQEPLQGRMCTAVQGWTCAQVFDFLGSTESSTGRTWLDLLGIDTLVVHRSYAGAARAILDREWKSPRETTDFVVLQRPADPQLTGRVTHRGPGIESLAAVDVGATSQVYTVNAAEPSQLVVGDVYWPGYRATWNGADLPVKPVGDALVGVEVPPGQGELAITYRPAGTGSAIAAVMAGLLLAAGVVITTRRRPIT